MSLVSLNSNGQSPHLFSCHFPQPIHIKPKSQVCLLKFLHFRDTHIYNITSANNLLMFCIGNTQFDAIRPARIPIGEYSGDELATAIEDAMNAVCQQQHYQFSCTFTPEDDTTSPPTLESFSISYASVATPAEVATPQADMQQLGNGLTLGTGLMSLSPLGLTEIDPLIESNDFTVRCPKGALTNNGSFSVDEMRFGNNFFDDQFPTQESTFGFDDFTLGLVRAELSTLTNPNPNLEFKSDLQDVQIKFDQSGIQLATIDVAGNSSVGSPNYAKERLCRQIPSSAIRTLFVNTLGLDGESIPKFRLKVKYTLRASARRVIAQLFYDASLSGTYTPVPDGGLGQDANGNEYAQTFTSGTESFAGAIWVSDNASYNDTSASGSSLRKQNILLTKKAPFLPTATIGVPLTRIGFPNLLQTGTVYEKGGVDSVITAYTGDHGYNYKIVQGADEYYIKAQSGTEDNPFHALLQTSDIAYTGSGLLKYTIGDQNLAITLPDGSAGDTLTLKAGAIIPQTVEIENTPVLLESVLNPEDRGLVAVENNLGDGNTFLQEEEVIKKFFASNPDQEQSLEEGTQVGVDVAKKTILLLRQLNTADVATHSGSPAFIRSGQQSGTIGSTIGSVDNILVANSASTGGTIFTSGQSTQRLAKDTVITVSVPELAGVKSFNGIDQGAGKNLSGVGKNIAVLPREEFEQRGESTNGSLVYVSPFENWLDINNISDVYLNQLTVEVRMPSGELAKDLKPDTIAQIKFRQDPLAMAEERQDKRYEELVSGLASAVQTGQILSGNIPTTGS